MLVSSDLSGCAIHVSVVDGLLSRRNTMVCVVGVGDCAQVLMQCNRGRPQLLGVTLV
jgi:hypothetical protein